MPISIELTQQQLQALHEWAASLGVPAEELARAVVANQLSAPPAEFESAVRRVLGKNRELYQRLS